jgi:heat-inducible transcriptional repressor
MINSELSDREKSILRFVIHQYILTASPVGSRNISKKYDLGLSPATVRNIMADLEELGFLDHPHTSAGRVPTDKGYRYYVDSLMPTPKLKQSEKNLIKKKLDAQNDSPEEVLKQASSVLSLITNQLACVTYPKFKDAVLEKIQLVKLSTTRMLIVISVKSGLIRTITMEVNTKLNNDKLDSVQRVLNERLSGLRFAEIKKSAATRLRDTSKSELEPIIRLFLDSSDKIFSDMNIDDKAYISGAKNVLNQPEFYDHDKFESVIELIENKDVIIHFMDERFGDQQMFAISIGKEAQNEKFEDYSLVSKKYKIGEITGALGIIGPRRMEYSKTVAAIEYIAEMLSKEMKKIQS